MSLEGKSRKHKSGAAYRREKQAKIDEERKLGSFMLNFLQTHATETDTPAVLDLARDTRNEHPVVALDLTPAYIHDDSVPTISCLESVDGSVFSIDSNPETFCVEMPAITPTVDACGSKDQSSAAVMCNQSEEKISLPVEIVDKITGVIDPAKLVLLKLSTPEKEYIIKNGPNQPDKSVLTSISNKRQPHSRHCSPQVFYHADGSKRQWVSYSPSKDALFCVPCILFSDAVLRGQHLRPNQGIAFTQVGFRSWKKQHSSVLQHEACTAHRNSIVAQATFLQQRTIEHSLNQQAEVELTRRKAEVVSNRTILKRIVDAIMFLGQQGLPMRGHKESLTEYSDNLGNFLELLKVISNYDIPLQQHLEKVKQQQIERKGARGRGSLLTFLSSDIQNKVIHVISNLITDHIVKAITECVAWALIADTTPDIVHHEQVSKCVRIVHRNGCITENLLACKKAPGTTAENLYDLITTTLKSKDISFHKLIAQAYDGASNMSGCYNGLRALIQQRINTSIVYIHCYAHTLNLVMADSAAVAVDVVTLFGNLETMYLLFSKSQKAHAVFEDVQRSEGLPLRSLKRLNTVRWFSRELCLKTFLERFECVLEALNRIQADVSFESKLRSDAAGLLSSIQTKQFLATAFLFREVFALTGPLSRYLQGIYIDLSKALFMIDCVISSLDEMRNGSFDILAKIDAAVSDLGTFEWRFSRVHSKRARGPSEEHSSQTPEQIWKHNTLYVVLDKILSSLRDRFENNRALYEMLSVFHPSNFSVLVKTGTIVCDLIPTVTPFCERYHLDFIKCAEELLCFSRVYSQFFCTPQNSPIDVSDEDDAIEAEENENIEEIEEKGESIQSTNNASSFTTALYILCNETYHLKDAFPELCKVYGIICAIPISSCTAERSFSVMKRVKTRLRSMMVQERLEGLLLMSVERKILLTLPHEAIIQQIAESSAELSRALL